MANEFMDGYNNLWTNRQPFNSDAVEDQHIGIIRMASVHADGLQASLAASSSYGLPEYMKAAILYYSLPKRDPGFKKLPKKKAVKKPTKKQARAIEKVGAVHNVNDIHAAQIVRIMKSLKMRIGE